MVLQKNIVKVFLCVGFWIGMCQATQDEQTLPCPGKKGLTPLIITQAEANQGNALPCELRSGSVDIKRAYCHAELKKRSPKKNCGATATFLVSSSHSTSGRTGVGVDKNFK